MNPLYYWALREERILPQDFKAQVHGSNFKKNSHFISSLLPLRQGDPEVLAHSPQVSKYQSGKNGPWWFE